MLAEERERLLRERVAAVVADLSPGDRRFVEKIMADDEPGSGRQITEGFARAKVRRVEDRHARLRQAFRALRPR